MPKKWLYYVVVSLFFAEECANLTHWLVLKAPMAVYSLFVVANTNLDEATDFISLMLHPRWLLLIPYILLFIYALKKVPTKAQSSQNKFLWFFAMVFPVVFLTENILNDRFIPKATPQPVKAFTAFTQEMKSYRTLTKREIKQVEIINLGTTVSNICVVILGESLNRKHLSLYGYSRNTSPRLRQRQNLILYDNVVTPHSNTLSAIFAIFTNSGLEKPIPVEESITLLDVFHSAGCKTYWLSNQAPLGVWDNAVSNFARTADVCQFLNIGTTSSFESTMKPSYDEILFTPFVKVLQESAPRKLIILHLMGSHSDYKKRYPDKFSIFRKGENVMERTINQYDNSVLYNDFIIDSLFSILEHHSRQYLDRICAAIYLSDHGENVYDDLTPGNAKVGHTYSHSIPKPNVEIPFMIWLSDAYRKTYPLRTEIIKNHTNYPFVTDDLYHSLMINTPSFSPKRSIFNADFNINRERILEDGFDYDEF